MKPHRKETGDNKRDTASLAEGLAPPEERDQTANDEGRIVVDTSRLQLPKDFIEENEEANPTRLEPVLIVVLLLALAFIAFIAWQISLMPPEK